jgi:RNA 2',3'-cyclic 3'-phosphodiesterase
LFFALWPPETLRERIRTETRALTEPVGGRALPAANFHITIAFLGEVPDLRLAAALQAGAATHGPAFELILDRVEAFRRSGVLSLVPTQSPSALTEFVDQLRFNLLDREFRLRHEVFRPHVTLVRDVRRPLPAAAVASLPIPLIWRVDEFALVESQLGREGSRYSVLVRWPLTSEPGDRTAADATKR